MMRRLLAAAFLFLPAAAVPGVRPRYGGELRVLLPTAPAELDPSRASSPADLAAVRAVHATLLEEDERGALRPALLEALPESEDGGRAWRLRLAAGLRFHDGQPVSAADVAASLARLAGPDSTQGWLAAPIEGAAAVRGGGARLLAGVQVLSDRDLRIVLAYPFPEFPRALAALPSAIAKPGVRGALVGAGPFRPARAAEGRLRLAPFEGFHGGRPFADALLLAGADARAASRALASGGVEVAIRPEPLDGRAGLETGPLGVVLAVVSRRLGPAAEPTRAALAAVDRSELTRFVRAPAIPLSALLPPAFLRSAPRAPSARAAGAPAAQLRLLLPEGADAPRAAAARIQVKLYDRGVHAALESAPAAAFAARLASGDFDAALVPVWLVSRAPPLALAQIAAAAGGAERGARALERAAAADAASLPALAEKLEAELAAVPLYAAGLRVAALEGVEGLWLRGDGTLELGDAWLMPDRGPAP